MTKFAGDCGSVIFTEEILNGSVIMVVGVMLWLWRNCCLYAKATFFGIPPKWRKSVKMGEAVPLSHAFNYVFVPFIISTYFTSKLFQFSIISILSIYIPTTISRWDYQWKFISYSVKWLGWKTGAWFGIIQESS